MKNLIFLLVILGLISLAVWWGASTATLQAQKGLVLEGLTHDVAAFYGQHGRLPNSWDEFVDWSKDAHTVTSWEAQSLENRFDLAWGLQIPLSDSESKKIFVVHDPRFKDIESFVNQKLYDRCMISGRDRQSQKSDR